LSNNHISKIENLPHNLKELSLTNNHIDEIEVLRSAHLSLIALGLSYNQIKNSDLVSICKNFPNLFYLDVSFNQLDDFRNCISWVESLEKLKMLYVQGNPIGLCAQAREILKQRMPELRILDGSAAFTEIEINDRKKFMKKMLRLQQAAPHSFAQQAGNMKYAGKEPIEILDNVKFELQFRLFQNAKGVYVNADNCSAVSAENPLNLDEVPLENKSQMYWLQFQDHKGEWRTT